MPDTHSALSNAVGITVQNLPTGPVVFMSGGIGLRYVEAGQVERLREALEQIHMLAGGQVTQYARAREQVERIAREALDA